MLKTMIRKSNLYFFGEEDITTHDFAWFYGFYAFLAVIAIIVATVNILAGTM
ncbi:hypothetical protein QTG56_24705 (plasmid) [Rossellomorea sp. AcN35-11]|nr:hypothetical protein [Rossellomorea aquimaris]WJV31837.1 hypothetical protein QTG56_24705 [Rossellomorea sp. AcN35-11]